MTTTSPGQALLREVKAGFILQGTSVTRWAKDNGMHPSNVRNVLLGTWDGPKGRELRNRVIKASRIKAAA